MVAPEVAAALVTHVAAATEGPMNVGAPKTEIRPETQENLEDRTDESQAQHAMDGAAGVAMLTEITKMQTQTMQHLTETEAKLERLLQEEQEKSDGGGGGAIAGGIAAGVTGPGIISGVLMGIKGARKAAAAYDWIRLLKLAKDTAKSVKQAGAQSVAWVGREAQEAAALAKQGKVFSATWQGLKATQKTAFAALYNLVNLHDTLAGAGDAAKGAGGLKLGPDMSIFISWGADATPMGRLRWRLWRANMIAKYGVANTWKFIEKVSTAAADQTFSEDNAFRKFFGSLFFDSFGRPFDPQTVIAAEEEAKAKWREMYPEDEAPEGWNDTRTGAYDDFWGTGMFVPPTSSVRPEDVLDEEPIDIDWEQVIREMRAEYLSEGGRRAMNRENPLPPTTQEEVDEEASRKADDSDYDTGDDDDDYADAQEPQSLDGAGLSANRGKALWKQLKKRIADAAEEAERGGVPPGKHISRDGKTLETTNEELYRGITPDEAEHYFDVDDIRRAPGPWKSVGTPSSTGGFGGLEGTGPKPYLLHGDGGEVALARATSKMGPRTMQLLLGFSETEMAALMKRGGYTHGMTMKATMGTMFKGITRSIVDEVKAFGSVTSPAVKAATSKWIGRLLAVAVVEQGPANAVSEGTGWLAGQLAGKGLRIVTRGPMLAGKLAARALGPAMMLVLTPISWVGEITGIDEKIRALEKEPQSADRDAQIADLKSEKIGANAAHGTGIAASFAGMALGQILIPIPILGGLIGGVLADFFTEQGIRRMSKAVHRGEVLESGRQTGAISDWDSFVGGTAAAVSAIPSIDAWNQYDAVAGAAASYVGLDDGASLFYHHTTMEELDKIGFNKEAADAQFARITAYATNTGTDDDKAFSKAVLSGSHQYADELANIQAFTKQHNLDHDQASVLYLLGDRDFLQHGEYHGHEMNTKYFGHAMDLWDHSQYAETMEASIKNARATGIVSVADNLQAQFDAQAQAYYSGLQAKATQQANMWLEPRHAKLSLTDGYRSDGSRVGIGADAINPTFNPYEEWGGVYNPEVHFLGEEGAYTPDWLTAQG